MPQSKHATLNGKVYKCTVSLAMKLIGGKWKAVIIFHLKDKEKRYNELRDEIDGITERTLSLQLKQLEQDGIITRKVYGTKAPFKVVYQLSDFGKSAIPLIETIDEWGIYASSVINRSNS